MRRIFTLESPRSLILPVETVVAVAIVRLLWWQYVSHLRPPLGLLSIPFILCPFAILVLIGLVALGTVITVSIKRTRSIIPTLFLLLGIVLVFFSPLPPRPDTPEKSHFLENRADYEAVVELARSGELGTCRSDSRRFQPPNEYAHVSAEACLAVSLNRCDGLEVTFFPLSSFYHHIVYVESGEIDCACQNDPYVEQQIDANWYVCTYQWN